MGNMTTSGNTGVLNGSKDTNYQEIIKISTPEKFGENIPELTEDPVIVILNKLRASKIDLLSTYEKPPICLYVLDSAQRASIATFGNFSCVIGKAKAKKTFLMVLVISSSVVNGLLLNKIYSDMPAGKIRVALFDTEQSTYKVWQIAKRICSLTGCALPVNLEVYSLRSYTVEERIEMIEYFIYNTREIGFIVIDGIRDLVYDINDPKEATIITGKLMKWTEELNIHIMTVLHQNKGDINARGHLGTEITNKAETVISVTKDPDNPDLSIVAPEYSREKEFEPFAFSVDENGLPYIIDQWLNTGSKGPKKILPVDIPIETQKEIVVSVFKDSDSLNYNDTWRNIKNYFIKTGMDFGDNKAKDFLTHFMDMGMIIKHKPIQGYAKYTSGLNEKVV